MHTHKMLSQRVAGLAGMNCSWSAGARGVRAAPAAVRPARTRLVQLVEAHYRFPNPLQPGTRLTGSKSKKVIRLWENEIALQQVRTPPLTNGNLYDGATSLKAPTFDSRHCSELED